MSARNRGFTLISLLLRRKRSCQGFTLIELLVVICIVAILGTVALLVYTNTLKSARMAKRIGDLQSINTAIELYRDENNHYPIATNWRSECAKGGNLNPDDVVPGLVPKYTRIFPSDPLMVKNTNSSCYMYISNEDGSGYKLLDYQISEFTPADYLKERGLIDPARDGGSDPCKVDGDSPEAWGFYTYNACAL